MREKKKSRRRRRVALLRSGLISFVGSSDSARSGSAATLGWSPHHAQCKHPRNPPLIRMAIRAKGLGHGSSIGRERISGVIFIPGQTKGCRGILVPFSSGLLFFNISVHHISRSKPFVNQATVMLGWYSFFGALLINDASANK
jgi:hypothetical protein